MNGSLLAPCETLPAPSVTAMSPAELSNAAQLANGFSEFIAASARLEHSYRQLQEDLSALRLELSTRNAALQESLAENRRMHQHLEQIVDSMPCGVLVADVDGTVSIINPEGMRLLGVHRQSNEGISLRDLSARSGIDLQTWCEKPANAQGSQEVCLKGAEGKRWIEVRNCSLAAAAADGNSGLQRIFILRDVTTQRREEQQRIAARKAMALAELTTMLAHEIRNPLGSLELFAELIEKEPAQRPLWISNLRAGIRSLSGTVNNVLSFHGAGALPLKPVPLCHLVGNALRFMQPLADQAEVNVRWMPSREGEQVMVMGDDSALQQVVLNLIANAIRHTPAGGSVTVSLRRHTRGFSSLPSIGTDEQAVVEFSDTGCGILPEQLPHIFEPGFSGRGDTSGLGLAVCRQIMTKHKGTIRAMPGGEGGAKFQLHFPLVRGEEGSPA